MQYVGCNNCGINNEVHRGVCHKCRAELPHARVKRLKEEKMGEIEKILDGIVERIFQLEQELKCWEVEMNNKEVPCAECLPCRLKGRVQAALEGCTLKEELKSKGSGLSFPELFKTNRMYYRRIGDSVGIVHVYPKGIARVPVLENEYIIKEGDGASFIWFLENQKRLKTIPF